MQEARSLLAAEPVRHNLILSLLHDRVARPEPGRYWIAAAGGRVAGLLFQSPLAYPAVASPMSRSVIEAMVDSVGADSTLPGVNAEAETSAQFAGQWAEQRKTPAIPVQGLRLYELVKLNSVKLADGGLRQATPADRELASAWLRAFQAEADEGAASDPAALADRWIGAGQLWFWEHNQLVAMAAARGPVEGVFRVGPVYTPPELRGCGYGTACVHELSRRLLENGARPCLYTDLGNPTSNSIYRRIGYRALTEWVRYRFG